MSWLLDSALGGWERGKKRFPPYFLAAGNCCHLFCLPFADNGKNCGKSEEINLNTLIGTLSLCLALMSGLFALGLDLPCSGVFSSRFSSGHWGCHGFGTGTGTGTGLGFVGAWAGLCWAVLGLGWASAGHSWVRAELGLGLGWAGQATSHSLCGGLGKPL